MPVKDIILIFLKINVSVISRSDHVSGRCIAMETDAGLVTIISAAKLISRSYECGKYRVAKNTLSASHHYFNLQPLILSYKIVLFSNGIDWVKKKIQMNKYNPQKEKLLLSRKSPRKKITILSECRPIMC